MIPTGKLPFWSLTFLDFTMGADSKAQARGTAPLAPPDSQRVQCDS